MKSKKLPSEVNIRAILFLSLTEILMTADITAVSSALSSNMQDQCADDRPRNPGSFLYYTPFSLQLRFNLTSLVVHYNMYCWSLSPGGTL